MIEKRHLDKPYSRKPQISLKQLWMFRIIAIVVIPLIFLAGLEIVLRVVGIGYDTHAIIESELDGKKVCFNNLKFSWRFFPKNIARDLRPFVFAKQKTPETYRIFVLGSSAARGIPGPEYNFARILEVMLRDKYPDTKFEVI
ncbi:MAG: hypothetical protein WC962_08865, partial [Phycisphaerae bacterium]